MSIDKADKAKIEVSTYLIDSIMTTSNGDSKMVRLSLNSDKYQKIMDYVTRSVAYVAGPTCREDANTPVKKPKTIFSKYRSIDEE